ncbi:DUF962 domain-containing protein [Acinetobacter equi]|uniref:DUF962 domain-containing protein n=1 Tax=Acinetobacter equi TaxID=1324350 RepID=A0A0N9W3L7_9GAMM|nr:Mpo1-like protein [Acinetobacter equi]ALH96296.1 hypothetical protein AOY20_12525 [Acinetobacter equi]
MTRLEKLLSQYAAYHLDRRNVLTHFIGIPLIVFSIICLTANWGIQVEGYSVTVALILMTSCSLYYLSLDLLFGCLMAIIFVLLYPIALIMTEMDTLHWLVLSIMIFVVGWVFQFIGHFYEKKKPAFMDDVIGLAIGPLFVLAEFIFLFGFRTQLKDKVLFEARKQRAEMDKSL